MRFLTSDLLESRCSLSNGWSRGDIFKFANTTHLDVRHFSVAKENLQIKQPTFPLSFVKERLKKKLTWLPAMGLAHLPVSGIGQWGGGVTGVGRGVTEGGDKEGVPGYAGKPPSLGGQTGNHSHRARHTPAQQPPKQQTSAPPRGTTPTPTGKPTPLPYGRYLQEGRNWQKTAVGK